MTATDDPTDGALGTDLALTRLMVADEWGSRDLHAEPRRRAVGTRLVESPTGDPEPLDLLTLTGRENLAQAVILRLLTPVGSLEGVGHPDYGSRLGELVGGDNNELARFRCRRHVLEALAVEPRAEVVDLTFADRSIESPDTLGFTVTIAPVPEGANLVLSFEVAL